MRTRGMASAAVFRQAWPAASVLLLCACGACNKQSSASDYEMRSGTVDAVRPETGEITVRAGGLWSGRTKEQSISCLLSNDAEVYVNDRFSNFDALAVGDVVELVGYRETSARGERFIVSFTYITRPEPPPVEPDLLPPATQPTSQPREQ